MISPRDRTAQRTFRLVPALLGGIALILAPAPHASAFHFPWDQGHDTTDWEDPTDPGPCEGPQCDPCSSTASPVYLPTGHFVWTEHDATILGSPALTISRTYNSHDPRRGMFGPGWTAYYEPAVERVVISGSIGGGRSSSGGGAVFPDRYLLIVRTRDGKRYTFEKNTPEGPYRAPQGRYEQVAENDDGSIEIVFRDGSRQAFNPRGKITSEFVVGAPTVSYDYDAGNRLERAADSAGRALIFSYGVHGRVERITDHSGLEWLYGYDEDGALVSVTDPAGEVRRYEYETYASSAGGFPYKHITAVIDATGIAVTRVTYSGERVASYTVGENVHQYTYSPGQVTKTDSMGSQWVYSYSDAGKITSIVDPLGHEVQFAYDAQGNLVRLTDPLGNAWTWTYDGAGRMLSESNPSSERIAWEFDEVGPFPSRAISPTGRVVEVEYDEWWNISQFIDPTGARTTVTWSASGVPVELTDALGRTTTVAVNPYGQPESVTDHAGRTVFIARDPHGRIVEVMDVDASTTRFDRDAVGRVVSVTRASGLRVRYVHDAAGRLLAVVDPEGKTTRYEYDSYGRASVLIASDGRRSRYVYRMDNLPATVERPDSVHIQLEYDAAKRLTSASAGGRNKTFTYSQRGELLTARNEAGIVVYTYDDVGRVRSETSQGVEINYQYNQEGELTGWSAGGAAYDIVLDSRGLPTTLSAPEGDYRFQYDVLGRRTALEYPNETRASYQFNDIDQLESLAYSGPFTEQWRHDYDARGVTSSIESSETIWRFQHDADMRLVEAAAGGQLYAYEYDGSGNRVSGSAVYDSANRLLEDARFAYEYDGSGRLTGRQSKEDEARTAYEWNEWGELVRVEYFLESDSVEPTDTLAFTYGPLGQRWSRTESGVTERFVYVGRNRVLTLDPDGDVSERVTFGPRMDEPLALNGASGSRFLHADHLGEIVAESDDSRTVGRARYGPYGEQLAASPDLESPFRYTGREHEREDLYYYRARYYDPMTGRFLTEDPLGLYGGDTNLYTYAYNNPIDFKDPTGWVTVKIPVPYPPALRSARGKLLFLVREGGGKLATADLLKIFGFPKDVEDRIRKSRGDTEILCSSKSAGTFFNKGATVEEDLPGTRGALGIIMSSVAAGSFRIDANGVIHLENLEGLTADTLVNVDIDRISLGADWIEIEF